MTRARRINSTKKIAEHFDIPLTTGSRPAN